jgi:hypothetical protein
VRLRDQNTIPNKDFILRFNTANRQVQSALLTHAPGASSSNSGNTGYFTLILQPPAAPAPHGGDAQGNGLRD